MSNKLAIIADDLTGSNDTGVQFSKKGLKTGVITDFKSITNALKSLDVLVVDTESRFDTKKEAYDKVHKVTKILDNNVGYIYKKLDSTLRGNIGGEIAAVMDAAEVNLAIVVPALPQNGRTTVDGIHLVNNTPLEKTEIAKDPITPVKYSYVPDIISLQTDKKIGVIHLEDVLKGAENISMAIKKLTKKGTEIVVIDALNSEDLLNIAQAIKIIGQKSIIAGSAGLAEYLPHALELINNNASNEGSVLIIAGSVSDITRAQVNYAAKALNFEVIDLNLEAVFNHKEIEKDRIIDIVKNCIKENKDIIVRSAKNRSQVGCAREEGAKIGLDHYKVSEKIALFLGEVTK
ncbi:MAG: four-carbon acid sugar kinase family protein, partial [Clostridia bacterium]|nr:four-carbon acid sugar kinase family protein [Clostridia bacterium]